MAATTTDPLRVKEEIVANFKRLAELYKIRQSTLYREPADDHRSQAFATSALKIARIEGPLPSIAKLRKIRGIGSSTIDAIREYIAFGRMTRLEQLEAQLAGIEAPVETKAAPTGGLTPVVSPLLTTISLPSTISLPPIIPTLSAADEERVRVLKLFRTIYGVGPATAEKWYVLGWRDLNDVWANYDSLHNAQQLGLTYYTDLQQRIPRAEITHFEQLLKRLFPDITILIAGSYRRGLATSGDADIIVQTKPGLTLSNIVDTLKEFNIIIGKLSQGQRKFIGIAQLQYTEELKGQYLDIAIKGKARQMDIRIFHPEEWPFGLTYNTGSTALNIQMRDEAIARGWTLSEYSLLDQNEQPIPLHSEAEIFAKLGIRYLTPEERSI